MQPTDNKLKWETLEEELAAMVADGLLAVTGTTPDWRYVVTPQGEELLRAAEEHDAIVRQEARDLAVKRHPANQEGNVIRQRLS